MNWRIALSDIDFSQVEYKNINKVLRSRWVSMGAVTEQFEHAFAKFMNIKHAISVSSGTGALHLALRCLGLMKNDEVILPSLTFVACANAIVYTGAKPVFADIVSLTDLNISPKSIAEKITPRTKAIIVVHYGGYICDIQAIIEITKHNNLYLIEDAAHAPGAEYNGRKAGTFGDLGCFSFFSNKNMTTVEGGMVVTNNSLYAKKIKLMRSHGMTTLTWDRYKGHSYRYDVTELGYNYRIDDLRASIGLAQLSKLEKNNAKRKALVETYINLLHDIELITIPFCKHIGKSAYHLFPILLHKKISRRKFMQAMSEAGIQTSIHYPPIHQFEYYRETYKIGRGELRVTEEVAKRIVTLPLHPLMSQENVEYICSKIRKIVKV